MGESPKRFQVGSGGVLERATRVGSPPPVAQWHNVFRLDRSSLHLLLPKGDSRDWVVVSRNRHQNEAAGLREPKSTSSPASASPAFP